MPLRFITETKWFIFNTKETVVLDHKTMMVSSERSLALSWNN